MMFMFDSKVASICGANSAVILQNLYFWVKKNAANERHFHDGKYWTYNSVGAFEEIFDYMTKKQIRGALDKLVETGLIIKGNYNKDPFDRTAWYALTDKAFDILEPEHSSSPKGKMCEPDKADMCAEKGECINNNIYIHSDPDNKQTDINTDNNSSEPEEPAAEPEPEEPEPEEPSAELEPPFITLPLNTGEEHPVTAGDVEEYKELYPAVNIEQALRSMRGWLLSNPGRRKTARGIRRFINSWLSREQDRGGNMRAPARAARSDLEAWANG